MVGVQMKAAEEVLVVSAQAQDFLSPQGQHIQLRLVVAVLVGLPTQMDHKEIHLYLALLHLLVVAAVVNRALPVEMVALGEVLVE